MRRRPRGAAGTLANLGAVVAPAAISALGRAVYNQIRADSTPSVVRTTSRIRRDAHPLPSNVAFERRKRKKKSGGSMITGRSGRRFGRVRKRGPGSQLSREKIEKGDIANGWNCLYVGHTTHPRAMTFKHVVLGLLQKYCFDSKINVKYWSEFIAKVSGTASVAGNYFECTYHVSDGSTVNTRYSVFANESDTWETFAIKLANDMIAKLNAITKYIDFVMFYGLSPSATTASTSPLPQMVYRTDDIMITVHSESIMQIQNQTSGDVTGSTNVTSVGANPMRGKKYGFTGDTIRVKETTQGGGGPWFLYDGVHGYLQAADRTGATAPGSSVWGNYEKYVKKPPSNDFFRNCTGSRYVNIEPGVIRKSYLRHKVTKSFHHWIISYRETFNALITKSLSALKTNKDRLPFSRSSLYGLEKKCDSIATTDKNELLVGYEVVLSMSTSVKMRRRTFAEPLVEAKIA